MYRVCVIGLGTVGMPTTEYIAQKGFDVIGYDVNLELVKNLAIKATTSWLEASKDRNVFVITVNTGFNNGKPDVSNIFKVCDKIRKTNATSLVCIESTVPVGTCREVMRRYGLKHLVHFPHRYWGGDPERYGVKQLRVLGALDLESLMKGKHFYGLLDIPYHIVPSVEIAEASKIIENANRYINIAFAEEVARICSRLGLNYDEVKKACDTKWNVKLMEARNGIHEKCLPKDTRYLQYVAKGDAPLIDGAIKTNEIYEKFVKKRNEEK